VLVASSATTSQKTNGTKTEEDAKRETEGSTVAEEGGRIDNQKTYKKETKESMSDGGGNIDSVPDDGGRRTRQRRDSTEPGLGAAIKKEESRGLNRKMRNN